MTDRRHRSARRPSVARVGWGGLVAALACASPAAAQVPRADSATLAVVTQQLFDAITAGDTATWARYLSARWAVTDEEGQRIERAEFLRTLRPLPVGQSGTLTVADWHLVSTATVAVTTYAVDEFHNLYGQHLETRFRTTDTWVQERDGWRLLASQITALPTPVRGRAVPRSRLEAYIGEYALTPDVRLTIILSDSGLGLVRRGTEQRLYAIDERIFIRHGVRGFWLFETDSAGAVSTLVNWRDNNAVVWRRSGPR